MKRAGLCAAVVAAVTGAAYAQSQGFEPAVPTPLTETRVEPPTKLEETAPARPPPNESRARLDTDARHCLDLSTNADVHRCAEPYRTRIAKQQSTRARARGNVLDIPPDGRGSPNPAR
jgi:hypothetical protein